LQKNLRQCVDLTIRWAYSPHQGLGPIEKPTNKLKFETCRWNFKEACA